jgi:hypothetical protein
VSVALWRELYSYGRHSVADLDVSDLTMTIVLLDNVFSTGTKYTIKLKWTATFCPFTMVLQLNSPSATYDENNCKQVKKEVGTYTENIPSWNIIAEMSL